jgi:putative hemolysin
MNVLICLSTLAIFAAAALYFSTLNYCLRDFSRSKLADYLGRHNGDHWFENLTENTDQFVFVTAAFRQFANLAIFISLFALFDTTEWSWAARYAASSGLTAVVGLIFSIALPQVLAKYSAEPAIGFSAPFLGICTRILGPMTAAMTLLDNAVKRILGVSDRAEPEGIEQEILSAVEEGEKEGIVDEQERELIENVIDLRGATAGHVMTARPDVVGIEITASLEESRSIIESSGYSRLPVFEGTLDKVIGILYARDLIKFFGPANTTFEMRSAIRPAMFVPETKPLRDLLADFRHQKVHIAIVLDEYGGTAGLLTIEDILEELVGEISDEHEQTEPAMFRKTGELTAEVDARLPVSELNRLLDLALPEDAGYETVGGFLTTNMGRIPEKGAVYEFEGAKFTVLDAQPQKIERVRIEASSPTPRQTPEAKIANLT